MTGSVTVPAQPDLCLISTRIVPRMGVDPMTGLPQPGYATWDRIGVSLQPRGEQVNLPSTIYLPSNVIVTGSLSVAGGVSSVPSAASGYNVLTYGADPTGATDSTNAIQAAISAVPAPGGTVYFPTGIYQTSAPLVVSQSGTVLVSDLPATLGGGGTGTGTFTPGTPGTITGELRCGAVICPSASWAQGSARAPAAVLFDGGGHSLTRCAALNLSVDGNAAGTTTCHGIGVYGECNGISVRGCAVLILYSASSHGFYMIPSTGGDPVGPQEPQGILLESNLAQFIGGDGFRGSFGDANIHACHAQNIGANGFDLLVTNAAGGDIRLSDCRGDLGTNGFKVDVTCGNYLGMVQLSNCTTQRNADNGFYLLNAAAAESCPMYLANCVAQGDGTAGGTNAGYRISGPVLVSLANSSCHVNHNTEGDGNNYPPYAVVTTDGGVSAPAGVQIRGGLMNGATAWLDSIVAPLAFDYRLHTWGGSQWTYSDTPALTVLPAPAAPFAATPADPSATASTSLVMMGLGSTLAFTPASSGKCLLTMTGEVQTNTAAVEATFGARYGTGTAPLNGAAASGTRWGAASDFTHQPVGAASYERTPFAFTAVLSLTAGTAWWFDIALDTNTGADTAQVSRVSMSIVETS